MGYSALVNAFSSHRDHPSTQYPAPSTQRPATSYPLVYNSHVIALAKAAMTAATWIFFAGIIGSIIVVVISFFEDLAVLVGKD